MTVRVVQVIYSDLETVGKGTADDLARRRAQLYTLDGVLICSYDCGPEGDAPMSKQFVNDRALHSLAEDS